MSRSFQKPENALKRAQEFIDVAKPARALDVLYEVLKRGKMRANYSEKLLEPIMHKFLELCVDLKKSHYAKEGLYQYRNICQSVNVSSLETVVRYYLHLADERTEAARNESHQAVVDVDDLDNLTSPEEMLLKAVSGEDAQDRSDRTILTPWVKFLWESYRQCLELLRTNSRVEKLYHDIAKQAFKFCEKYNRKTEFRKLCENLRTHLSNIQKQQGIATAVNLNNPETQQMNLETRLEQLNSAVKMELWQEAYKAIEDISDLMNKSKKMPKPQVMAMYFLKLALVFMKAGNLLFHAAALFKHFQLVRDQKKNITEEELSKKASVVLLATLAIPLPSAHPEFDRFIETEKSAVEKIDRLAMLLSLPKPPTRASLIRDITRFNVVSTAPAQLQQMFSLMETQFDPLNLCNRMSSYFEWITEKNDNGLSQYISALKEMTICRLIKQVGQIYDTIDMDRLLELSVFVDFFQLERVLVDLVRHNDLQIRIDHRTASVKFGVDLSQSQREDLPEGPTLQKLPSEQIRCQLVDISSAIHQCLDRIYPDRKKKMMEPIRVQTIQSYQQSRKNEHQRLLQRQHIIEERKEMLENQNLEREESQRRAQEEQRKKQKDEEQARLRREASKREQERHEEQMKLIQTKQIKDKLLQISKTSYGQKMIEKFDKEELLNLGAEEILQRQVEELEKERKELQKKLKTQEKSIDYFERARRLIEIPKMKALFTKQKALDKENWKVQEEERIENLKIDHKTALEHCRRLKRMTTDRNEFIDKLKESRKSEVDKKLNEFNARLTTVRTKRLLERKEQRKMERREAYLRQKEEEEQLRREEEVKKAREEEERIEAERMQKEEEEEKNRKREMERQQSQAVAEAKPEPYKVKRGVASLSQQKEQEKYNAWRPKGDEQPKSRFISTDIRKEEPEPEKFRAPKDDKDDNAWRRGGTSNAEDDRRPPSRDIGRGSGRDTDRVPPRDFERGPARDGFRRGDGGSRDDFRRGDGGSRDDFRRGDGGSRDDFRRGDGASRDDFRRGDGGSRDDFRRGDGGSRDDFRRGDGGSRDDFRRGDGGSRDDFRRGDGGSRDDFRRGGARDDYRRGGDAGSDRVPSGGDNWRDMDRSNRGASRGYDRRDTPGRGGGGLERRGAPARNEEDGGSWRNAKDAKTKKDDKREPDSDGWQQVRR